LIVFVDGHAKATVCGSLKDDAVASDNRTGAVVVGAGNGAIVEAAGCSIVQRPAHSCVRRPSHHAAGAYGEALVRGIDVYVFELGVVIAGVNDVAGLGGSREGEDQQQDEEVKWGVFHRRAKLNIGQETCLAKFGGHICCSIYGNGDLRKLPEFIEGGGAGYKL